jgi:hypothetical protein
MKTKDQVLLEEAYKRVLINENPDVTRHPVTNQNIMHDEAGARAFGFLSIVEERKAEAWHVSTWTISFKGFPEEFKNKFYIASDSLATHQELFKEQVADDILNSPTGIVTVQTAMTDGPMIFDMSENMDVEKEQMLMMFLYDGEDEEYPFNARQILAPAGRIWTKQKIISFWSKEGSVTPEQLDTIFSSLNIPKEEADTFFIEFAGDRKPTKKVHDYTSGGAVPKQLTDKEEKEAAEAMAKAHGAAAVGTKDTAVQKVLKSRKEAGIEADAEARAAGRKPDLRTQQMAQTSEATETFYSFFNK